MARTWLGASRYCSGLASHRGSLSATAKADSASMCMRTKDRGSLVCCVISMFYHNLVIILCVVTGITRTSHGCENMGAKSARDTREE